MFSTKSGKISRLISTRNLNANLGRKMLSIIAIVLTTLLITAVLTMALSINKSMELAVMKTSGSDFHGSFKYLNLTELKKLQNSSLVKESGTSLIVGEVSSPLLKNNHLEVLQVDENYAKHSFVKFIEGGLPIEENEISLNTWALDLLGLEHKLGERVQLNINIGDKVITKDFKVSGYYEADKNLAMSGLMFVSKKFTNNYLSNINPNDSIKNGTYVNTYQLNVLFKNSFNINKKLEKVLKETGLVVPTGINPAFTSTNTLESFMELLPFFIVILITMVSGYLLIYNIFYISVVRDVKFYGLLNIIGTTPRQIKKIISYQANVLYFIALPFGLGLGFLLGSILVPLISSLSNYSLNASYSTSPWIFISSAFFSYITVIVASRKPAKLAMRVSPIDALKFSEVRADTIPKKIKRTKQGAKIHLMALSNLLVNKKKLVLMVLSLSISIVLFSTIYIIISSFDLNKYLDTFISGDLMVQNEVLVSISGEREGDPYKLNDSIIKEIKSIDGVNSVDTVYYKYEKYPFDDTISSALTPLTKSAESNSNIATTIKRGFVPIDLYGIDPGWYKLINNHIIEGSFNKEKFDSGNYILISTTYFPGDKPELDTYYHPGDKIIIPSLNKSYEIMALLDSDALYAATTKHYSLYGFNSFLPTSEMKVKQLIRSDSASIVSATITTDPDKLDSVKKAITALIDTSDELTLKTRGDYVLELNGFIRTFKNIGYGLSVIIAIIGLLNYINTVLTGIIARKHEFALLESIGMTKRQLKQLLIYEGIYYILFTVLSLFSGGLIITYYLSKSISNSIEFTTFHMRWAPFFFALPMLLFFVVTIVIIDSRFISKYTIIERLKVLD